MNKKLLLSAITVGVCALSFVSAPAFARTGIVAFQSELSELNRIKPLQNPRHESVRDVLNRTVIDRQNKVVGEVGDVIVDRKGRVSSLFITFDRIQLSEGVYLNYRTLDISNVSNGYKIGMDAKEIASAYPALLSEIETAAGEEGDVGVSSIVGQPVTTDRGITIGKIDDILFDQSGGYIRAVYVAVNSGTIRDKGVAVPFDAFDYTADDNGNIKVGLAQDYADKIIQYAKNN